MSKPYIQKRDLQQFLLDYHDEKSMTSGQRQGVEAMIDALDDEYHLEIDPDEDL